MKDNKFSEPHAETGSAFSLDRREFLKVLGGGIVICFAPVPDSGP